MSAHLLLTLAFCFLSCVSSKLYLENSQETPDENTLVLVHVLFRHGERTPTAKEIYPNDPYKNYSFPLGYGQLTKRGQLRQYMIGKNLRNRYDHFLGQYNPEMVYARSTNYSRTRISCELVTAGLFPPNKEQQIYEGLNWQPILCEHVAREKDALLEEPNYNCPKYKTLYTNYMESVKESYQIRNNELYDYVSNHSGLNIQQPYDMYNFAFSLTAEESMGLELPEWTKTIWPEKVTVAAAEQYDIYMATMRMRQLAGGVLLRKIVDDTKAKINGDDSVKNKKIFLYSAHENNIAAQLILLNAFYPHIPPYGSFIIYEVHKINNVYGFRILYQDYTSERKLKVLHLPGCESFCPIDQFEKMFGEQFARDEDMCLNEFST